MLNCSALCQIILIAKLLSAFTMGKRNGLSDFINMSSLKYDSKQKIIEGQIFSCCLAFQSPYLAVIPSYVLCVQEVVTHFYSKLLYKMGHYFLDIQYKNNSLKIAIRENNSYSTNIHKIYHISSDIPL